MRAAWIAIITAMLAACQAAPTAEQSPADVEDAKKNAAGAQSGKVGDNSVATVDLTGKNQGRGLLTDPNSILSKRSIYYDYDKFDVKDDYKALVEAHAKYLRDNPKMKMLIQGNTDERGSREYNIGLGERRAQSVRRALMLQGANASQITTVSYGEERPAATGSDEEAWRLNRRVEIVYR
jgi:peptidoglycan-associated lipoprotein